MNAIRLKSHENFTSGLLLKKNKLYSSSIHCFYYSCIQTMIHILLDNLHKTESEIESESFNSGKTFHNWIINKIYYEHRKINRNKSLQTQRKMYKLKKLRVEADYKNVRIEYDKSDRSEKISKEILNILNKDFLL